jgi:transcription termination/antitermination protein NusG
MSTKHEWYAVRTRSNFEAKVRCILSEKRIEAYLPVFREIHRWKDRRKLIELPLFPGYVFARFADSREGRLSVLSSNGVVRILGAGEQIERIPENEIEGVRRLVENLATYQSHPLLHEGAWVRVKHGPLRDIEGVLVRIKSRTRLVVSISLLSQSVSTEIDAGDVEFLRSASVQARRIA